MDFFMLCILYHKIPWWPVQRETEGRRKLVQLYIRNQGRKRGGGPAPWIVHREENVVADQPSSDWRKRRRWEGDQRSESTKLVSLCGQWVCCFFNCSSSPHPPSLVPPRFERSIGRNVLALFTAGRAVGFTFPETKETRQRKSIKSQTLRKLFAKAAARLHWTPLQTQMYADVKEQDASLLNKCGEIPMHNKKKCTKR